MGILSNLFKKSLEYMLTGDIKEERITPQELEEARIKSAGHPEIFDKIVKERIDSYEKMIKEYQGKNIKVPQIFFDNLNTLKESLRRK